MKQAFYTLYFVLITTYLYSQSWSGVGSGFNYNPVHAFAVYKDKLYAGGYFKTAGGVNARGVASWDGTKWDSLGTGADYLPIKALAVYNDELYAGGTFGSMGGVPKSGRIARWDGTSWKSVDTTESIDFQIYAMAVYKGELYVGGNFTVIGGINVNRIARWDGTTWKTVGGGVTGSIEDIRCMSVYNNELYVGGLFTQAGGKNAFYIARWDGTVWNAVGTGLDFVALSMAVDSVNNTLYVGGSFSMAGGIASRVIAKWDGSAWSGMPNPMTSGGTELIMYHNQLYIGSQSTNGWESDTIMARWDGNKWNHVKGINNTTASFAVYHDTLFVGGYFDKVNGQTVNYIAKYYAPPVGVEELKINNEELKIKIIPNPATNTALIHLPGNINEGYLLVHDLNGKTVKKYDAACTNSLQLDLTEFKNGTYFCILISGNEILAREKLVVVK